VFSREQHVDSPDGVAAFELANSQALIIPTAGGSGRKYYLRSTSLRRMNQQNSSSQRSPAIVLNSFCEAPIFGAGDLIFRKR
jgi:hypothetical protein